MSHQRKKNRIQELLKVTDIGKVAAETEETKGIVKYREDKRTCLVKITLYLTLHIPCDGFRGLLPKQLGLGPSCHVVPLLHSMHFTQLYIHMHFSSFVKSKAPIA